MALQQKDSARDLFIKLLGLFFERFLKPIWLLIFILGFILLRNWNTIIKPIHSWGISEYRLVKDYISIIVSFPIVILILGLILLLKFASSIKIFLENSYFKGAAGIVIDQKSQIQTEASVVENDGDNSKTITLEQLGKFKLFDTLLVYNTKSALHWFYLQTDHTSSLNIFNTLYNLPPEIINPEVEKNSILSALCRNELLKAIEDNRYEVAEVGKQYLKYLGVLLD